MRQTDKQQPQQQQQQQQKQQQQNQNSNQNKNATHHYSGVPVKAKSSSFTSGSCWLPSSAQSPGQKSLADVIIDKRLWISSTTSCLCRGLRSICPGTPFLSRQPAKNVKKT
eukprot:TRINITY_DN13203_c0_g1_i1.p1 TRINITY_DN13203_c0_g1~~TRINITY_DN13203_c0_g1_i1.p1  ORF type:complete len:111 (-),score=16.49 TRINITY_DN13203_c0_g1_i1:65-397(-)